MNPTAVIEQETATRNGVDVAAMLATIDAVKRDPALARFEFRATNTWQGGSRNRSVIKEFSAGGAEDETRLEPFVLDADEPAILLGEDRAANPVEFVLHALAACMTTTMTYHAAARGIAIEAIESTLEGGLDLRGFLDLAPEVRKGYQQIRVRMRVKSAASAPELKELTRFSPVHDMISRALPVEVVVETY